MLLFGTYLGGPRNIVPSGIWLKGHWNCAFTKQAMTWLGMVNLPSTEDYQGMLLASADGGRKIYQGCFRIHQLDSIKNECFFQKFYSTKLKFPFDTKLILLGNKFSFSDETKNLLYYSNASGMLGILDLVSLARLAGWKAVNYRLFWKSFSWVLKRT